MDSFEFREKLIQVLKRNGLNDNLVKDYDEVMSHCIEWSIDDFEHEASLIEESVGKKYDRNKFEYALECMIKGHDAEWGISWSSVRFCLNDYCLLKPEEDEK